MSFTASSSTETLEKLKQKLKTEKKVYYTRFGDGEVYIMIGKNTQDHKFSKTLQSELIESFSINHPNYLKGLSVNHPIEPGMDHGIFAPFPSNDEQAQYLCEKFGFTEKDRFESAILFLYLSAFNPAALKSFIDEYIKPKKKMIIGSMDPSFFKMFFGSVDEYVQIPISNCYQTYPTWKEEVFKKSKNVEMILPFCGVTSEVLAKELWHNNWEGHFLDLGSFVDAVTNPKSRKWLRVLSHRVYKVLPRESRPYGIFFNFYYAFKELKYYDRVFRRKLERLFGRDRND